jgi:hypothetical protein
MTATFLKDRDTDDTHVLHRTSTTGIAIGGIRKPKGCNLRHRTTKSFYEHRAIGIDDIPPLCDVIASRTRDCIPSIYGDHSFDTLIGLVEDPDIVPSPILTEYIGSPAVGVRTKMSTMDILKLNPIPAG